MSEFLIFTIGPVQAYIAAARRTEDLWAGSRILSKLMAAALAAAPAEALRYPLPDARGAWPENVPNRAVLLLADGQGAAVGAAMETAAHDAWDGLAAAARDDFATIVNPGAAQNWLPIWGRQVPGWLEVYWAVRPWDAAAESYGAAYRATGRLLEARKMLRHFPAHAEPGVKSTLDPAWQALRGTGEAWDARRFWDEARRQAPLGLVARGERLSSIDVVKRLAQHAGQISHPEARFPSTSSLASADFRLALMQAGAAPAEETADARAARTAVIAAVSAFVAALDALVAAFPATEQKRLRFGEASAEPIPRLRDAAAGNPVLSALCRYDGDYFYPDTYTEARLLEALGRDLDGVLGAEETAAMNDARGALLALYKACGAAGIDLPSAYYAALALDGDHMGRLLSDPGVDAALHQQISRALSAFAAADVPRLAGGTHPAAVVYAGGDDVLALAPVSAALPLAEALQAAFTARLAPILAPLGLAATMSAGLAIAHQQNPLQAALGQAGRAQATAKDGYARAALVVNYAPRSGEERQAGGKWRVSGFGREQEIAATMAALQGLIKRGLLSGKVAYELRDEAEALAALDEAGQTLEITRLLRRHSANEAAAAEVLALAPALGALAADLPAVEETSGIELLAEWAVLARFLALGGRKS